MVYIIHLKRGKWQRENRGGGVSLIVRLVAGQLAISRRWIGVQLFAVIARGAAVVLSEILDKAVFVGEAGGLSNLGDLHAAF